ncbi:MAG TPA: flagellar basal body P-ring formation chaperone FlgA [Stellaceae bacterium]
MIRPPPRPGFLPLLAHAAAVLALILPGAAGAEPRLRAPAVTVDAPVIRLGDLFDDAGDRAEVAVAPSPAPGGRAVFDAVWLANVAAAQKLAWRPATRADQVAVERASRVVTADMIAARIAAELRGRQAVAADTRLELDNPGLRLFAPAAGTSLSAPDITIRDLSYDARSGRVAALVVAGSGGGEGAVRVGGRLLRMVDMPVLARLVAPGETIAARDIERIAVRADRINQAFVGDASDLVGKTPRRAIRPNEPVRVADIQTPIAVHKGELVTIVLETPSMRLTAQGKAVEDGAQGAPIRVSNTKSGRVIEAVVSGPGIVAIASAAMAAAAPPPQATPAAVR